MYRNLVLLILLTAWGVVSAQEQSSSPQALIQAAFRQAQKCQQDAIIAEAQLRTEMQAQLDALRKQLEVLQAEAKKEKQ